MNLKRVNIHVEFVVSKIRIQKSHDRFPEYFSRVVSKCRFHNSTGFVISHKSNGVMKISRKELMNPQALDSSITSCHSWPSSIFLGFGNANWDTEG
ncbi:hypothetical protein C5167_037369 [Papaver somniferum]|uniref:Uncharacterized protein n=1 Tax=Papaver somniferum TaxID=3469 RepID=A0A4Y7IAI1_PAPSO|nr:hypothetical protein C5167_037369 [Papaver somniferum]